MTQRFEKTVAFVNDQKDIEYTDFHARRLVETAGNIVIGYLLLHDANRNDQYKKSADLFILKAQFT
jgi:hypothetical protein